jgi:hypothetical protein
MSDIKQYNITKGVYLSVKRIKGRQKIKLLRELNNDDLTLGIDSNIIDLIIKMCNEFKEKNCAVELDILAKEISNSLELPKPLIKFILVEEKCINH